MLKFLDRTQELAFLHSVLTRTYPGPGQFLMIYGRRPHLTHDTNL